MAKIVPSLNYWPFLFFFREMVEYPRLKGFKCPTLIGYDGGEDPKNYIFNFQSLMALYTNEDQVLC